MPKTYYTERDIEDLARQGVRSLLVDEDVALTDLAYEKARRLGVELLQRTDTPPAAPIRPYITNITSPSAGVSGKVGVQDTAPSEALPARSNPESSDDLHKRVYNAVIGRLGDSVDPKLLDTIIQRVLKNIDTK
ncbi:MAG: hypothetical protein MUP03_06370 [Anaerolineales bacterium]|nr:hypothetical protein [Anaerolineales bacterium]